MDADVRRRARTLFAPYDDVVMGDPGGYGPNESEVTQALADAVVQARNEEAAAHADCCVDRQEIARLRAAGDRLADYLEHHCPYVGTGGRTLVKEWRDGR